MIITDNFVFIHVPKTGGTFVEKVLKKLLTETGSPYEVRLDRVLGQHQTVREIPKPHRNKKVLAAIRNPYDYYVSVYEFGRWKWPMYQRFPNDNAIRRRYPHYPDLTFSEFMEVENDWSLQRLRHQRRHRPWNSSLFVRKQIGHFTYFFLQFVSDNPLRMIERIDYFASEQRYRAILPGVHFIKTSNLNHDLVDFLLEVGYEPKQLEFILHMDKVRPPQSPREDSQHWSDYYTPTTLAQVRYLDRAIFTMFPEFDTHTLPQVKPRQDLSEKTYSAL